MQAWQWLISPKHKKKKKKNLMQVGFLAQFFFLRGHVVYLFF
jgi:hypothetical protein